MRHPVPLPTFSEAHAYAMGKDCACRGATGDNCHFRLFATPALTRAWERGKADGDAVRNRVRRRECDGQH